VGKSVLSTAGGKEQTLLIQRIDSLDDPRVAAYRNLRDRTLRGESLFVAEGRLVVRRLLESRFEAESVFVAEQHVDEFAPLVGDRIPLYVAPRSLFTQIVGFRFHLGALAVGRRQAPPAAEQMLGPPRPDEPLRLVACPEVTKPENLGLILRTAAAFALDGLLLGPQCCDPLSRRALRVSMGASLQVPWARSTDMLKDLRLLKEKWQLHLVAAVLDPTAELLERFNWPERVALLVGGEYEGLSQQCLQLSDQKVTIPMAPGVDSLNLGVATGVFVYQMTRPTRSRCS